MSDVRFVLRRATLIDAASLASFAARTFLETFGSDNDPQHMAAHLATSYGPAQQHVELADPAIVTRNAGSRTSGLPTSGSAATGKRIAFCSSLLAAGDRSA